MTGPDAVRAVALAFLAAFGAPSRAHDAASPSEQLGSVSFAASCQPEVQATLERGVALLHSFWFLPANKAFRDIAGQLFAR